MIRLADACAVVAELQDRVQATASRLRCIRNDAAADPKTFAVPMHVMHSRVALPMAAESALVALDEYRAAVPKLAHVLCNFPAANDDIGTDAAST